MNTYIRNFISGGGAHPLHPPPRSAPEDVIRMETGLPTKKVFDIVVNYALRFKDCISYFAGWNVELISFEDQIFISLMKARQNYTNLHLAQLFHCSVATISNTVITFIHVLHGILFDDLMTTIPQDLCTMLFQSIWILSDCHRLHRH